MERGWVGEGGKEKGRKLSWEKGSWLRVGDGGEGNTVFCQPLPPPPHFSSLCHCCVPSVCICVCEEYYIKGNTTKRILFLKFIKYVWKDFVKCCVLCPWDFAPYNVYCYYYLSHHYQVLKGNKWINTRVPIRRHGIQKRKKERKRKFTAFLILFVESSEDTTVHPAILCPEVCISDPRTRPACGRNTMSIMSQPFLPFTGKELTSGTVSFCQKPGPLILAHQLASGSDVFGQNLIRPSRSDLGRLCAIESRPSLEEWNWIRCRKLDLACTIQPNSGCMLPVLAITYPNQDAFKLDPASSLGRFGFCLPHRLPKCVSSRSPCSRAHYLHLLMFSLHLVPWSQAHIMT